MNLSISNSYIGLNHGLPYATELDVFRMLTCWISAGTPVKELVVISQLLGFGARVPMTHLDGRLSFI